MAENEKLDPMETTESETVETVDTPEAPVKKEKAEKKAGKKPEKKSKPGVFARIGQWFKETKAEKGPVAYLETDLEQYADRTGLLCRCRCVHFCF